MQKNKSIITQEEEEKIKHLYYENYSILTIAKALNKTKSAIQYWIKKNKIVKIHKCHWCGKISIGKKTRNYWLCRKCENHRCLLCTVILSNTRKCKNKSCKKIHGQYEKGQKICSYCRKNYPSLVKTIDKNNNLTYTNK